MHHIPNDQIYTIIRPCQFLGNQIHAIMQVDIWLWSLNAKCNQFTSVYIKCNNSMADNQREQFYIGRNIVSLYQPRIFTAWIASALNFIRCRKSWNKFRQLVFFMNKFTIPHTLLKLQQSPDRKRVRPKKPILLLLHHSLLSNLCFCVITFWLSTFISDCIPRSPYTKEMKITTN